MTRTKKMTLLALAAVTIAAVPSMGLARSRYTGSTPASLPTMSALDAVTGVAPAKKAKTLLARKSTAAKKVTIKSKHKKHKKHKKIAAKK